MQTVVETRLFSRHAGMLLTTSERQDLIAFLAAHPLAGDVIPGTGGIRKLRWQARGKSKSGGAGVIYYAYDTWQPIYSLLIYGKRETANLSPDEKPTLTILAEALKAELRSKR